MTFEEGRARRGLGVGDLAREAGVLPVIVEKLERDEIVPLHLAWSVADALGFDQDERLAAYKAVIRGQQEAFNGWASAHGAEA